MLTYKFKNCLGETINVKLGKTTYRNNDTLAVIMYEVLENGEEEEYDVLTVNISDSMLLANDTNAFIDTNNLGKEIIKWLVDNKIATTTPFMGFSGYCSYPLMSFTKQALDNMVALD